jgi:RNA polymerase sigma factor (sigma-70 family)
MPVKDSQSLLADYVVLGSEQAFRELVDRYVDLVHSAAVRLVDGDTHLAEDLTQTVFLDLARTARKLPKAVSLGGWLHRHTYFTASKAMRAQRRRQRREREATEMSAQQDDSIVNWERIAPMLDGAIDRLVEEDRTAILLRFFEQRDFRSVGDALGIREDAARMRVNRALEKLQGMLKHSGVTLSSGALAAGLTEAAVLSAPSGMAAGISSAALIGAAGGGTTFLEIMSATKLKLTLVTLAVVGVTTLFVMQQQSHTRLQKENETLQRQMAQLQFDAEGLAGQLSNANNSVALSSEQSRELLRLRGEVGALRRRAREIGTADAKAALAPAQIPAVQTPVIRGAAPFQVQLVLDEPGDDVETVTNRTGGDVAETLYVKKTPVLDYNSISTAVVRTNEATGAAEIDVEFSDQGREQFANITKENINKRLAIVLGGQVYSAPVIRSEITGGKAQISGQFSREEAEELAAKINEAIKAR